MAAGPPKISALNESPSCRMGFFHSSERDMEEEMVAAGKKGRSTKPVGNPKKRGGDFVNEDLLSVISVIVIAIWLFASF